MLLLICLTLTTGACAKMGLTLDEAEVRTAIESALAEYLPELGKAYSERNPQLLVDLAVAKEIASIDLLIDQLAERGEYLVPELERFTVEDITMSRNTIAIVTVLEVWDVSSRALGSGSVLQHVPGQRNRVKYQMRLLNDRWMVTFRTVVDPSLS